MLSHVLHEVWVAYFSHPPLGLVFAVSPACSWDEDRDMPPSDCLLLSARICAPLFSHGLLKALLHSVQGYSLCTLLFFQYWKSLLSTPSGHSSLPQWSLPAGLDQSPVLYLCFPGLFSFGALCCSSGYHLLYLIKAYLSYQMISKLQKGRSHFCLSSFFYRYYLALCL